MVPSHTIMSMGLKDSFFLVVKVGGYLPERSCLAHCCPNRLVGVPL